jgi:hypothetical protein
MGKHLSRMLQKKGRGEKNLFVTALLLTLNARWQEHRGREGDVKHALLPGTDIERYYLSL